MPRAAGSAHDSRSSTTTWSLAKGDAVVIEAEVDPVAVLGLFLSEPFRAGDLEIAAHLADREEALEGELLGADLRPA